MIRAGAYGHPPTLDQAILAEFITEGHLRQTYPNASTYSRLLQTNTSMVCSTLCTRAQASAHSAGSEHGSPISTRRSERGSSGSK
jgi:hypothetical protein